MRVLIVEDDLILRETLRESLQTFGFDIVDFESAQELITLVNNHRPDVVLLDEGLPHKTGSECLRELRGSPVHHHLPVIMLTGTSDRELVVSALDGGADDFIKKPVVAKELAARIRAVCRRAHARRQSAGLVVESNAETGEVRGAAGEILVDGNLKLCTNSYRVHVDEQEIFLTLTEFRLLQVMFGHREQVLSRDQLRQKGLGSTNATDRTVDVHIAAIRRKLGVAGDRIRTVRGVGYCFEGLNIPVARQ